MRLTGSVFPAKVLRKRARATAINRQHRRNILSTDERTSVRYNRNMARRVYDWKAVQQYVNEGHGFVACHRKFGFAHATWARAIVMGELAVPSKSGFRDARRRYNWAEVQRYYSAGRTYRECRERFGFCAAAWHKAVERGEVQPRSKVVPLQVLLATSRSRASVRNRLLRDGVFTNACSDCGLTQWRGRPISMHIDHINGIRDDHRLENLRMLCPNCHSQTPTYGGRNAKKRRRSLQDPAQAV